MEYSFLQPLSAMPMSAWWKSEFNVFGGKIVFRGNGIDQDAVPVKAGQKAYLDFKNNTGEIK